MTTGMYQFKWGADPEKHPEFEAEDADDFEILMLETFPSDGTPPEKLPGLASLAARIILPNGKVLMGMQIGAWMHADADRRRILAS